MVDRLSAVFSALLAANHVKPPKIAPYPRPVTAMDKAREKRRRERHAELVGRVLRG